MDNYDRQISDLQKQKAQAIRETKRLQRISNRRAFWLGQALPVLCFLAIVLTALILFGK